MSAKTATKLRSTIGEALVAEGVITEEQLTRALRVQQLLDEPRQLGDLLFELGYASNKVIAEAIVKHGGNMRLGEMLVEQGIVRPEVLEKALEAQKERGVRLGEALMEMGAINERTLIRNIAHQSHVPYIEPSFAMLESNLLRGVSVDYLQKYQFVPFSKHEDGRILVVVPDLEDEERKSTVEEIFQGNVEFALGPLDAITLTIEDFKKNRGHQGSEGAGQKEGADDAVIKLVEHLLTQGIEEGASDIHIEPMDDVIRVRYRIDGVLVYKTDLPADLLPKVISRIKVLAECNITEHQRHQGGRIIFPYHGGEVDLRVSIYVSIHGESAVFRVLNKSMGIVGLSELGMTPSMLERFRDDVLDPPTGVVLITGPTGSGKTSTLYSSIDYCNDYSRKIITAEDPVEYTIDGIVQCSIYDKGGRGFAQTLREIVRQDPDIIVLGEIRDKDTAQVAIQAALTGHKVYSTFHTEDTVGGVLRLIDMEIEAFLIASTVVAIVAQRLLRRICQECSMSYSPTAREASSIGLDIREVREYEYKRGRGCAKCSYTGFRGRVAAYELLVLNEEVKDAILNRKSANDIREISVKTTGLMSMREDGIGKVLKGVTTFEEVMNHTPRTFSVRPLRQIISRSQ
jgi:type IV pilus assembly protein PilB